MFSIIVDNVNEALPEAMNLLKCEGERVVVRGMETIEFPEPVTTGYVSPWQRVLFSPVRDGNPFFHFMESMWLLAGRRDVAFLHQFNSKIHQYSDNGEIFHGAYGWRLRNCGMDQLEVAIKKLKEDPTTRQVVLQIWDMNKDLGAVSKDIPCNDLIFVKIRNGKLNITVCCRSNDVIWGAYGSNVVQFSYLQEYLAGMVGVEMGYYHQVSDSFHVYTGNPQWDKLKDIEWYSEGYDHEYYPMIINPATFDLELDCFVNDEQPKFWCNPFFPEVAIPIWTAWIAHKERNDGWKWASDIKDTAWRKACLEWLARREDYEYFEMG